MLHAPRERLDRVVPHAELVGHLRVVLVRDVVQQARGLVADGRAAVPEGWGMMTTPGRRSPTTAIQRRPSLSRKTPVLTCPLMHSQKSVCLVCRCRALMTPGYITE